MNDFSALPNDTNSIHGLAMMCEDIVEAIFMAAASLWRHHDPQLR